MLRTAAMPWFTALLAAFLVATGASASDPTSPSSGALSLRAEDLQISFDLGRGGGVTSLAHGSVDVVKPGWDRPTLFLLGVVEDGNVHYYSNLDFPDFKHSGSPGSARFEFRGLAAGDVEVVIDVTEEDGAIVFRPAVHCGPGVVCSDLMAPYISGYESLSGNPDDDRYLYPHLCGEIHLNPARPLREKPGSMIGSDGYPGTQGVQLHALYTGQAGIMMWTPDPASEPKRFGLRHDAENDSVGWFVQHYFDEVPGFDFRPDYEVRLQACAGSWEAPAEIYAAWGRKRDWMKKVRPRPGWIEASPMLANVNDNEHWSRVLPSWVAEHQPEMNAVLGPRPLIHTFQQWEGPGHWIAPDSFPPIGGEEAMVRAAREVRSRGNHLKHMFSAGEYWLHPGLTEEFLKGELMEMAVLPRGWTRETPPRRKFDFIGDYVVCDPSSRQYQDRLVELVGKISGDYGHDFISLDIWPLGQPRQCYNPRHSHPPGLGKWYVDANIALLKRLHEAAIAHQPQAIFGGESMAEPYLPWMDVTIMRSALHPVSQGPKGRIDYLRVPLFDYIYGDQVETWDEGTMSQREEAKGDLCVQFTRGDLLDITDRWHHQFFDLKAMGMTPEYKTGDPVAPPVLRKNAEMGDEATRASNLRFAAALNDFQKGPYHEYFARGRGAGQPRGKAKAEAQWRPLKIYDQRPAVWSLRKADDTGVLWTFGNGGKEVVSLRLVPPVGKSIAKSTLKGPPNMIDEEGSPCVELALDPLEFGVVEWRQDEAATNQEE